MLLATFSLETPFCTLCPPVVGTGPLKNFYYSFNYGPVHFLVYSSEHPFGIGTEQHAVSSMQ
jgi:hypothetical protein